MSDRETVYNFDAEQWDAAEALAILLQQRNLDPHLVLRCRERRVEITLSPREVRMLKRLQRVEPERFGGC